MREFGDMFANRKMIISTSDLSVSSESFPPIFSTEGACVSESTLGQVWKIVVKLPEVEGDDQGFDPWPRKAGWVCRMRVDAVIPTLQYYAYVECGHI
jgi:hypothetical protein